MPGRAQLTRWGEGRWREGLGLGRGRRDRAGGLPWASELRSSGCRCWHSPSRRSLVPSRRQRCDGGSCWEACVGLGQARGQRRQVRGVVLCGKGGQRYCT